MPIIALNNQEHKQLRVRTTGSFEYLANAHMLPLVVQECGLAGSEYPVVFVKKEQDGEFQLVAIFGLTPGENLFVNDGQWNGLYLPAIIQNSPFKLIPDPGNPDNLMMGLDTDSDLVQESDGEALFDDAGNETDFLKNRKELLGRYFHDNRLTREFCATVVKLDLLVARDLKVRVGGQEINIAGLHIIDEAKLGELPDDQFNELRQRGFLPAIYAHLVSLNQVQRLARFRSEA